MEAIPSNIDKIIGDLPNEDEPILSSNLADLTNMNSIEQALFERTWPGTSLERRRKIISLLVELAEENFELNFDSIFKSCLRDKDAEIRSKAIEGLWENEEPSLINPLIRMLNEDSSETVRASAATALGKFALLAEVNKLRPAYAERIKQALLAIIADKNKPAEIWRRALESAAPFTIPQITDAINEAYQSNDPRFKTSAIFAMGKNCNSSWLPILLQELNNENVENRYEAVGACGEIGDKNAVPELIKLTKDTDIEVRLASIQALGKIGGPKSKQCLMRYLDNPDDTLSEAAEQALRQLDAEEDSF
jgi:HEAT repeat protein